jgi:glycosyltransferase involved in cell wall biosynthesis
MNDCLPKISVIIPVYNGEEFIADAINSALAQQYEPLEIIVINDCSSDNTTEIVRAFKNNVILINNDNNCGASSSRNKGIHAAKGELIAFLDADDLWAKNKLKCQVDALNNVSTSMFCYGRAIIIPFKETSKLNWATLNSNKSTYVQKSLVDIYQNPYFSTSTILISKQLCLDIGLFREDLNTAEDIDFCLKAASLTSVICIAETLSVTRRVANSLGKSSTSYRDNLDVLENFSKENSEFHMQHIKLVSRVKRKIYDDWIKDLLFKRKIDEALSVLKKSKKIAPSRQTITLLIKAIILKMVK